MQSLAKSGESLGSAIRLMTEISSGARSIHQAVDRTSTSMGAITESSHKVAGILRVIDEIAFQTNLIALNAAVEAARAGAAGAGFAVVADEVRTLAHRCATAAKETAAIIDASLANIEHGNQAVKLVSTGVAAISTQSASVAGLVSEVQEVSQSHAESIARLSEVVAQIKGVIDNLASSAEENARASTTLTKEASDMQDLVTLIAA
jgi:methyl-accepting chemotaxis protein